MTYLLSQTRQEDVFRSISENVGGSSDPTTFYYLLAGAAGLVVLLALISARKKRAARPRAVNHQGRLMKEILRRVPLKKSEVKHLRTVAGEQGCASPLTLILCPSVLAKGLSEKSRADRKVIMNVARKMGVVRRKTNV
ncbi:MAG: hypothetical protein ACAI43_21020 [Phycisphaerae bacterium]|nr:hypothetical protein [Tepidisphaeraceae bacterium]